MTLHYLVKNNKAKQGCDCPKSQARASLQGAAWKDEVKACQASPLRGASNILFLDAGGSYINTHLLVICEVLHLFYALFNRYVIFDNKAS